MALTAPLLRMAQVEDFNKCLQLGNTPAGDRLFSSSLTPNDIDNFLCHSCEPNCRFVIGRDLTAGLVATKPIAEVSRTHRAPPHAHRAPRHRRATAAPPRRHAPCHAPRHRRATAAHALHAHVPLPAHRLLQGEAINFDYDETEDDLRGERGGFECHCGTQSCRGQILGRLYSPKPPGSSSSSS